MRKNLYAADTTKQCMEKWHEMLNTYRATGTQNNQQRQRQHQPTTLHTFGVNVCALFQPRDNILFGGIAFDAKHVIIFLYIFISIRPIFIMVVFTHKQRFQRGLHHPSPIELHRAYLLHTSVVFLLFFFVCTALFDLIFFVFHISLSFSYCVCVSFALSLNAIVLLLQPFCFVYHPCAFIQFPASI